MGNKYQSNVRTFMAKNVIWNSGASPIALYEMDAPNTIQLSLSDCPLQPFNMNMPTPIANLASNYKIIRAGLFSNFADGLVLSNICDRLRIYLSASAWKTVSYTGSSVFTKDSNIVTGAGLPTTGLIMDSSDIQDAYLYSVLGGISTSITISDFAYRNATLAKVYKPDNVGTVNFFDALRVPVLNAMFDTELYFINSASYLDATKNLFLFASLDFYKGTTFDLYTKTVDTSFNELPVSFDVMLEAEITSSY